MSLVADYSSDSNNSDSEDSIVIKTELKLEHDEDEKKPLPGFKLPVPNFGGQPSDGTKNEASVFVNPFLEAENAKEAILQKHVKMINAKDTVLINGKKICWNYRKGRCRFGHNCKFAHDSDLQKTKEQLDIELEHARYEGVVCQSGNQNISVRNQHLMDENVEMKEELANGNKKRKRPGLTQGLIPGKKVMKQYRNNKS